MGLVFMAVVVAISIPALLPVIQDDPLSISHRKAVMAFAASSLLQIVFLISVEKQTIPWTTQLGLLHSVFHAVS
jgi:hypothetical protein